VSIIARSIKGTLVGSLTFLVQMLQSILIVPIMLQAWGAPQFGVWLTLQAGMGMLLTLETGHLAYVGSELGKALPVDRDRTRTILGAALRFAVALAIVEGLVVAGMWATGTVHLLLGVSAEEERTRSLGAALFFLITGWLTTGAPGGVLARLYPPSGNFVRGTIWSLIQKLVLATVWAGCALARLSILQTAICAGAATLVYSAAVWVDAGRTLSQLQPFFELGSLRQGWNNFARSLTITGSVVIGQLQTSGVILVVSYLFDETTTASFATVRTLSNAAVQASALISAPAIPEFVRLHVQEDYAKTRVGLYGLSTVTSCLAVCGALLLAIVADPLYSTWTRGKIPFDASLFHLVEASVIWRIAGSSLFQHLAAMNRARWIVYVSVGQTAALFAVFGASSQVLGVDGMALGMIASEFAGTFVIPAIWLRSELPEEERAGFSRDALALSVLPALGTCCLVLALITQGSGKVAILLAGVMLTLAAAFPLLRRVPLDTRQHVVRTALRILPIKVLR
jgi:O-antigen/teichoic acid export membrane protein